MTIETAPFRHPRLNGQQADIAPGSPVALEALMTEVIRERFRIDPTSPIALPYAWSENPTDEATVENTVAAPKKIFIEPAFSVDKEVHNARPAIYVNRLGTSADKVVIGNFAGQHLPSGLVGYYAQSTCPFRIDVVSGSKGESATLGDLVWFYLLASRTEIMKCFNFHDFTNPDLSGTTPYPQDKDVWVTSVSFALVWYIRWTTVPISPLLDRIIMRYRDANEPNPDVYLLKQYLP